MLFLEDSSVGILNSCCDELCDTFCVVPAFFVLLFEASFLCFAWLFQNISPDPGRVWFCEK